MPLPSLVVTLSWQWTVVFLLWVTTISPIAFTRPCGHSNQRAGNDRAFFRIHCNGALLAGAQKHDSPNDYEPADAALQNREAQ